MPPPTRAAPDPGPAHGHARSESPTRLERAELARNTASTSLDRLGFGALEQLCRTSAAAHPPVPVHATDPRDGLPIIYSDTRAARMSEPGCVVCDNRTCPAVDLARLPADDLAYLTPNLYPIVYPFPDDPSGAVQPTVRGLHLVQWSSLDHGGGLVGADRSCAAAIVRQAARAEEFLLHHADAHFPDTGEGHRGHVAYIKNRGRRVGGSVEHDHQQLMLTSVAPAEPLRTAGLGPRLRAETPRDLLVDRVDGQALTLVPTFMRRPLHAFIVPAGPEVGFLHHLDPEVLDGLALAVARLTHAITALMTNTQDGPAWNLIVHTGPGRGPLVELRPFTQPLGGYEHLGLYLCEETPVRSAERLRQALPDA